MLRRRGRAAAGLPLVPPGRAGEFDIVLLAVPVPALAGVLALIAPHLRAGQIVADVCSVKEGPAALMRRALPEGSRSLPPTRCSARKACPAILRAGAWFCARCAAPGWRRIAAFLRHVGLKVILTTPAEHDRHAALTQGLTHLLARALDEFQPHPLIRTRSFDLLCAALDLVRGDAPEVYEAVTRANPHVASHVASLGEKLVRLSGGAGRDRLRLFGALMREGRWAIFLSTMAAKTARLRLHSDAEPKRTKNLTPNGREG